MKTEPKVTFSAEEQAAMKARAKELKAEAKRGASRAEGERALLEVVEALPESTRTMGLRIHRVISENAPDLMPKTWYGMPAYANEEGKVVVFFRGAEKFKERYLTLGFNDVAKLDEGVMWPIAYALTEVTPVEEVRIAELVRKAVGG